MSSSLQDSFGIYTTVELRGKHNFNKVNRPETFDSEPRSIFYHCFYPTVDTTMDPFTLMPKGLLDASGTVLRPDLAKLWDSQYRGWGPGPQTWNEEEGGPDDLHLYGHGKLKAKFQVDLYNQ